MKKLLFVAAAILGLASVSFAAENSQVPVSFTGQPADLSSVGCELTTNSVYNTAQPTGVSGYIRLHWVFTSSGTNYATFRDTDTRNTSSPIEFNLVGKSTFTNSYFEFNPPRLFENGLSMNVDNSTFGIKACYSWVSTNTLQSFDMPVTWNGQDISVKDAGVLATVITFEDQASAELISTTAPKGLYPVASSSGTLGTSIYEVQLGTANVGDHLAMRSLNAATGSTTADLAMPPFLAKMDPTATSVANNGPKQITQWKFDPPFRLNNRVSINMGVAGPNGVVYSRGRRRQGSFE